MKVNDSYMHVQLLRLILKSDYTHTNESYSVGEEEARVAEGHVLEEAVEVSAEEGAPGTPHVAPRLCLLETVVVVEEVVDYLVGFRAEWNRGRAGEEGGG